MWNYIFEIPLSQLFPLTAPRTTKKENKTTSPMRGLILQQRKCFIYVSCVLHSTDVQLSDTQKTRQWHRNGRGWTKQERGRRGKEWGIKVNLFLLKAGDCALCSGLSRSFFCPLDFIASSTSLWWCGTCHPGLVLEGGWRGREEPQGVLNQKLAQVLTCPVPGGWEHTAARSHPHLP